MGKPKKQAKLFKERARQLSFDFSTFSKEDLLECYSPTNRMVLEHEKSKSLKFDITATQKSNEL